MGVTSCPLFGTVRVVFEQPAVLHRTAVFSLHPANRSTGYSNPDKARACADDPPLHVQTELRVLACLPSPVLSKGGAAGTPCPVCTCMSIPAS
eukprot:scaffold120122_cov23-Tisochrysis_lutea.AAC.2